MKLALLGADDDALALLWWAVDQGGHQLVAAFDVGNRAADVRAIAPQARLDDNWESLVIGSAADAVIVGRGGPGLAQKSGIQDAERRADQFRKLAQAAVPMLVVCPACEAIVGFEIEMIRRDTRAVIVPFIPSMSHPGMVQLTDFVSQDDSSPIGRIEQISMEREHADRSREAVLVQLSRDVALLRQLIGAVQTVSASGPAAVVGRDPLGPKPKELPALANLSVHFSGDEGLVARWTIAPALTQPQGRLTVIGASGKAVLHMPVAANWSLEIAEGHLQMESLAAANEAERVLRQIAHALAGESYDDSAWLAACRDQEAAEAVDRSLLRGRTIELYSEEHTEEESFKGVMAMGGCLLLLAVLATVLLAALVEGLRLPIRNWAAWRLWPLLLLAPVAAFLLLQLLQFAVKREASGKQLVGGEQSTK